MATKSIRKPYQKVPPTTWDMIRRRYESGQSPLMMCQQWGITPSTFFSRRKREGWSRVFGNSADVSQSHVEQPVFRATTTARSSSARSIDEPFVSLEPVLPTRGEAASTTPEFASLAASGDALTACHLETACVLRYKLDQMMADEHVGAGPQGRKSRSLLDLVTALEKLQRIERTALAMDQPGSGACPQVVILVPHKLDEDEWVRQAQLQAPVGNGGRF